jgi:hypothetical protein
MESSLIRLVNGMRYFGAGSKVTRSIYKFPDTYWIVKRSGILSKPHFLLSCLSFWNHHRVKLSKDQDHGKVYGRLIWRGRPQPFDREIHSARKKQWKMISVPNYATFKGKPENYENLVTEAQQWFDKNGEWVNPELKNSSTPDIQTAKSS